LEAFSRGDALPPRFRSGKICLSLPETVTRRASFLSQGLAAYEIFDGLRNTQGWIGCGLSYKYLLQRAKMGNIPRVLICEDDVVLTTEGEAALSVVEEYLESLKDEWDVFVGLIAHLHPDVKVSQVDQFGGLTFVHLDKMTSMVLNIYNHSIYDLLISWDESNEDPKTNTIDRYLENSEKLRVVTAVPFIVGHSEDDSSTLWGFGNEQYVEMISRSQDLLQKKVRAFTGVEH
jgi:Glycosyltransferase family 25 (LPS biosynthesis protein)